MKKNYMLKQIFNKQVISHYRHLHTLNFNEIIDIFHSLDTID